MKPKTMSPLEKFVNERKN